MRRNLRQGGRDCGFSLMELLVATAIVGVLLVIMSQMLDVTNKSWIDTLSKTRQHQNAHLASDYLATHLRQATLKTYWDYYYASTASNRRPANGTEIPESYVRQSELHFLTGPISELIDRGQSHGVFFQAPLRGSRLNPELDQLLSARGLWIEFAGDSVDRPDFINQRGVPERFRYRLVEFRPPPEQNLVYLDGKHGGDLKVGNIGGSGESPELDKWFVPEEVPDGSRYINPIADNIIAMFLSPRSDSSGALEIAPQFVYDSSLPVNPGGSLDTRNMLPPRIDVTLVHIDETVATQLQDRHGTEPPPELQVPEGLFTEVDDFADDLQAFEEQLQTNRIKYHITSFTINLRESKWSEE